MTRNPRFSRLTFCCTNGERFSNDGQVCGIPGVTGIAPIGIARQFSSLPVNFLERRFEIRETEVQLATTLKCITSVLSTINPKGAAGLSIPITPHALTFDLSWAMLNDR